MAFRQAGRQGRGRRRLGAATFLLPTSLLRGPRSAGRAVFRSSGECCRFWAIENEWIMNRETGRGCAAKASRRLPEPRAQQQPPAKAGRILSWPKRGERMATPRTLAQVDLTAITSALAAAHTGDPQKHYARPQSTDDRRHLAQLEEKLAAANGRIASLEEENCELKSRLARIASLAAGSATALIEAAPSRQEKPHPQGEPKQHRPLRPATHNAPAAAPDALHPPPASCCPPPPGMRRRASPGASSPPWQASSRAAATSMPGARTCGRSVTSPKAMAW